MKIIDQILQLNKKQIAILIDPDKVNEPQLLSIILKAKTAKINYFFVGGSLLQNNNLEQTIITIKNNCTIPVVLFPGNSMQISKNADAILLLSLLSGRNADFLIGNHIHAAPILQQSNIEIIPTAYLLIESGTTTSVEYISNTKPIPANKPQIVATTALAGQQLGMKLVYLEAGSGAKNTVSLDTIKMVKQTVKIPIIVGGGIKNIDTIKNIFDAGANLVVIGTAIENDENFIEALINLQNY